MANPNVTSFSLSHLGILDGSTAVELADLYGINEVRLNLKLTRMKLLAMIRSFLLAGGPLRLRLLRRPTIFLLT